jgi:uncharacterized protein YukE
MSTFPDPIEGDPDGISAKARIYKQTATRLKNAADDLRDLTDDETFVSLAVDEIRLKALDARTSTESISVRYDGAADGLLQYSTELRAAQDRANRALTTFHGVDGESGAANRLKDDLESEVLVDNGQTPDLVERFLAAKRAAERYAASAAAAMAEYNAAVEDKNQAVDRAIRALNDAADSSNLNDDFFEKIAGKFQEGYEWAQVYLAPILKELRDALKTISDILSTISLIVGILAVFIPALAPLAAALKITSLLVAGAVLLCSLALFALGKGSLGQMLGDAVGFATSLFMFKAGGKLVEGIAGKLGAATVKNGGFVASSSLLNTTVKSQVAFNVANLGLKEFGAGMGAWGTEYVLKENLKNGLKAGGGFLVSLTDGAATNGVDLAPSAAGPSWNAPPPISVANVYTGEPSAINASFADNTVGGSVSNAISTGVSVSAAAA